MQVIVLGMHRSGTSTVSRLLNLMGLYFGAEGISTGANEENKKGFWERKDVRELNDFILRSNDFDWYKISNFKSTKNFTEETKEEFTKQAKNIILSMDAFRPWFVKEPRLCLNFDLWKEHLEVPVCIYVYRNPLEVAKSLKVRNGFPIEYGLALWEKYNLLALRQSQGIPTFFLDYNRLMQKPNETSAQLIDYLKEQEVPLRRISKKEISAFIDPKLYRQRVNDDFNEFLSPSQLKLYHNLIGYKKLTISEKDLEGINEFDLNNYEKIFERGFKYSKINADKIKLEKDFSILSQKADSLEEQNVKLKIKSVDLEKLVIQRNETIKKRDQQLNGEQFASINKNEELRKKEENIRKKNELISAHTRSISSLNEKLKKKEEELINVRDDIEYLKSNLKTSEGVQAKLKNELNIKQQEILSLRKKEEELKDSYQNLHAFKIELLKNVEVLSKDLLNAKSRINKKNELLIKYWNQIQKSRITNRLKTVLGLQNKGLIEIVEKEELILPIKPPSNDPSIKIKLSKQNKPVEDTGNLVEIEGVNNLLKSELDGAHQEQKTNQTSIIIPVYNAYEDVIKCIDSVINTVKDRKIIAIDDASSDERIIPMLKKYEKENENFILILNVNNLGYTRSINKAIISCANSDIVLVNSDTIVTDNWIDFLEESAYVDKIIGSVTAISNNAGAFSVPKINSENTIPDNLSLNDYARFVRSLSDGYLPQVPTGSGFIFYVKSKLFQRIGFFDEFNFPRGYGEENDFCQRIIANGYVNIIDPRVYIYHKRSASFKEEKNILIKESKDKLARIHPTYKPQVTDFIKNHPLKLLAEKIEKSDLSEIENYTTYNNSSINILFIIHDGGGGSIHTNKDLVDGLKENYNRFILFCGVQKWKLYDAQEDKVIEEYEFENRWFATEPCGHERLLILGLICRNLNIQITHFRSIIAIGPEALQHAKNLGMKVIFSLHDFIIICPTIQLIDNNDNYCGGVCTSGEGKCKLSVGWFGDIPNLKHDFVYKWRSKIQKYLVYCDKFITTSEYSKKLFIKHFPILADEKIRLIEHGRDLSYKKFISKAPEEKPIRVVIFGAMNIAKGTRLLYEIFLLNSQQIVNNNIHFEFHIFGNVDSEFQKTKNIEGVIHHGAYHRDELYDLIEKIEPSYAMITSIWPETYCHTLTESWLMGLPVFASDIGTIKERVEKHGGSWLMDYTSAENWLSRMLEIVNEKDEFKKKTGQIGIIQIRDKISMVKDYQDIYKEQLNEK